MRKKPEVSQSNDPVNVESNEDLGVSVVKRRVNNRHKPVKSRYEGNAGVGEVDSSKGNSLESSSVSRFSKLRGKLHRSKKKDGVSVELPIQNEQIYKQIHSVDSLTIRLFALLMRCENLPENKIDKSLKEIEGLVLSGADVLKPLEHGISALSFASNNLMGTSFYYRMYSAFMQANGINASAFVERSMLSDGKIKYSLEHEDVLRARISYLIEEKINDFLYDGDTWLHRACRMGDRDAIVAFIALGASHKACNRNGVSPLALIADNKWLYDFYNSTIAQLSPFLVVEQPIKVEKGVELLRTPETQRKGCCAALSRYGTSYIIL